MLGSGADVPAWVLLRAFVVAVAALAMVSSGCMALSSQLEPTDFAPLEALEDRAAREAAYADNAIVVHREPQGVRYTKGSDPSARRRSWQSLDAILRSDRHASEALPYRKLRLARLFTALAMVGAVTIVAGAAASAREGLDLKRMTGPAGVLLGGGIAAVGFGVTAGIFYGQSRSGYEHAVAIYNDSLGMRLGVLSPDGRFVPPKGVVVDSEGFVVLDDQEAPLTGPAAAPAPAAEEVAPAPAPAPTPAPAPAAVPQPPAGEPGGGGPRRPVPGEPPATDAPPPAGAEADETPEPRPDSAPPPIQRANRPPAVALRPRG